MGNPLIAQTDATKINVAAVVVVPVQVAMPSDDFVMLQLAKN